MMRDKITSADDAIDLVCNGDVAEEPLDHVQARRRSRRGVHVEARIPGQPRLRRRVLVRGAVAGDQVQ